MLPQFYSPRIAGKEFPTLVPRTPMTSFVFRFSLPSRIGMPFQQKQTFVLGRFICCPSNSREYIYDQKLLWKTSVYYSRHLELKVTSSQKSNLLLFIGNVISCHVKQWATLRAQNDPNFSTDKFAGHSPETILNQDQRRRKKNLKKGL